MTFDCKKGFVGEEVYIPIKFKNVGGVGRFFIMSETDWFSMNIVVKYFPIRSIETRLKGYSFTRVLLCFPGHHGEKCFRIILFYFTACVLSAEGTRGNNIPHAFCTRMLWHTCKRKIIYFAVTLSISFKLRYLIFIFIYLPGGKNIHIVRHLYSIGNGNNRRRIDIRAEFHPV